MSQVASDSSPRLRQNSTVALPLARLQAFSGMVLASFVAIHLVNFLLAAIGPGLYDRFQSVVRLVYQFPPVEAFLLGAIVLHLTIAVVRFAREPRRQRLGRFRWHRYSGVFLMLVIVGHVAAVRGPSWFAGIYPGAEGLAFTLNAYPAYFYPYYFLLASAGFYHSLQGTGVALARLNVVGSWANGSRLVWLTAAFGVFAAVALAGLGGLLYEIPDPFDNDAARLFRTLIGSAE